MEIRQIQSPVRGAEAFPRTAAGSGYWDVDRIRALSRAEAEFGHGGIQNQDPQAHEGTEESDRLPQKNRCLCNEKKLERMVTRYGVA